MQLFFFVLSLRRFMQIFVRGGMSSFSRGQHSFHYKFYVSYVKRIASNFGSLRRRFLLDSKLVRFRRLRRLLRRELSKRVHGYKYKLETIKNFSVAKRRFLTFYSLFKKRGRHRGFNLFFSSGFATLMAISSKKLRRIKRKLTLATMQVYSWNKFNVVQISLFKMKRKPFSFMKLKRLAPIAQLKIHIQKQKLYSKLYQILFKFLLSYRITGSWLKLRGLVVFFNIQQNFVLNRHKLRRLLYSIRNSFYLRYYKNKPYFLNALLFTVISMYYRSPFLLNEALCSNLKRM